MSGVSGRVIEAATVEDLDRLVDLWVDLVEHGRSYDLSMRAEENRLVAREVLVAAVADDRVYVARDDDRVVGFCHLQFESGGFERDRDRGVIENLYVEPDYREAGLGSDLLEAGEERLAELGAEEVALEALVTDERVRSFYSDYGFSPTRVTLAKRVETNR